MCHVLIIEDEPLIAMIIQASLEEEGATSFDIVATQQDAVACAIAHRPDAITSDVKLLHGTGPAAVEQIQQQLGDIPVIFITGTPAECYPCQPPGVILVKPVRDADLRSAFRAMR